MSDLISREAVLKEAMARIQYLHDAEDIKDHVKEVIETEPPIEQTEWISIKDRLPKENGMYEITLQTDSGYRYVAEDYFLAEHNCFEAEPYYRGVGRKIIAWQPIIEPSPYKGEEDKETETWNGIHAQITAPKGTFDKIWNDTDDRNDI